jgi:class 3 adenylate cyclase
MSLRYRLFLWVSGLFIVVSICSYFLENFVAQKELKSAQIKLRREILKISEQHRIDIQNYLASAIAENEVRIDAILNNLASFSPQALRFGPTAVNALKGTWGDVSDLLIENKWIDFIQNTNEGKTTAALIPNPKGMDSVYRIPIDEDLCWVYGSAQVPYLGVRVPYSLSSHAVGKGLEQVQGVVPDAYLLFELEAMKTGSTPLQPVFTDKNWPPIPVKWTEGYELDVQPFVQAFQRGRNLLLSNQIQPPQMTQAELKEKMESTALQQNGILSPIPTEILLSSVSNERVMKKRFEEIALRYTQINVIWVLIAMFDSEMFGTDLFSFPSPSGATVFAQSKPLGTRVETKDVLFPERIFDDSAYYLEHASKDPHSNLGTSLAVISSPVSSRVFLGNTAQFRIKDLSQERTGYLTLGVDADFVLQKLVLAMHQAAVLVHGGKPVSAYSETGEEIDMGKNLDLPFGSMLEQETGLISWNQQNYFFIRVQPFPKVDLHFFLFNPEEKEFALLHDLETGSQQVVDTIRLNTHLAGLAALLIAIVLLHNISRNITKPIVQLAKAAGVVAKGHLDQVKLPPQTYNDEIATLCRSFGEMVKGLQEKEKVQGVLNKVVSPEIAREILKGGIHLGGEEKRVSVLFADIREFTHMTQGMAPQEVIFLLNQCMTKISQIIDKNKGVIDKFVGDEAMALFGAPVYHAQDALHAIKSAVEIMESIQAWNKERQAAGAPAIELGIGIHTGAMCAGNMGAESRLNYTVIGSNVNLAFRLCACAKKMEILITKDTLDEPFVKEHIEYVAMPPMQFKGFDHPVDVYRVLKIKT